MAGEKTRRAIAAQPEWLRGVPTDRRLPDGARVVFTGCGTSFHAALAGVTAVQALDLVDRPADADILVLVSHEGETRVTLEAARAFPGPKWLVTGKADGPIADLCEEVVVATPEIEESYCHTASYTCAVAAIAAMRGEDVSDFPAMVERALAAPGWQVGEHERYAVVGPGGQAWGTVEEATLKLREAAHVPVEAHHTEQLLHGHLSAIDENVRCFVLAPPGRTGARAADVVRALDALGAAHELVEAVHPVVDIVPFQRFAVDLADGRGVDADLIRWDDPRWKRARDSYA
jgi:glucosamine 6-phosphate synthetase-like amidotransferase/phosphosugar isomerase protein